MSRSKHQHKKNYLGFSTSKLKKLTSKKSEQELVQHFQKQKQMKMLL